MDLPAGNKSNGDVTLTKLWFGKSWKWELWYKRAAQGYELKGLVTNKTAKKLIVCSSCQLRQLSMIWIHCNGPRNTCQLLECKSSGLKEKKTQNMLEV